MEWLKLTFISFELLILSNLTGKQSYHYYITSAHLITNIYIFIVFRVIIVVFRALLLFMFFVFIGHMVFKSHQ